MRVAIVGSGISGLAAAHTLAGQAHVTMFEAADYFGGHTHTVDVTLPVAGRPVAHGVDTGFLVFNERTYPELIALFAALGVETAKSEMSFSVQARGMAAGRSLEWSGSSLNTVFAQRRNLLSADFWSMLRDLMRFNALTSRLASNGGLADVTAIAEQTVGGFLREQKFSKAFCEWYFLPMMACIWSCPTEQMLQFPLATMIRFCHNHGLIQVRNRPAWRTVRGGAKHYVGKIVKRVDDARLRTPVHSIERALHRPGVTVSTAHGTEHFDKIILATHSDQSLALLRQPNPAEREVLSAIRYQPNHAVLHTDVSMLPSRAGAWAAWNYERAAPARGDEQKEQAVCLHYLLNRLQPLPWSQPVIVSLNPLREISRSQVMGEYRYAHPVLDLKAIRAQNEVHRIQGRRDTYFCGAWMGYGFHEDGLKAGQQAARQLLREMHAPQALAA